MKRTAMLALLALGFLSVFDEVALAQDLQCKSDPENAIFSNPQGASVQNLSMLNFGVKQSESGDWSQDIAAQQSVLDSQDVSPNILFVALQNLASAYQHEDSYPQAFQAVNTAIKTHAAPAKAYTMRSVLYLDTGAWPRAIADASQAISIYPCQKQAYIIRATAYRQENQIANAKADEATVIQIDNYYIAQAPNNPARYLARGIDEEGLGAYGLAIADDSKAIALKPDDQYAYEDRGDVYDDERAYVQAVSDETQAVTLDPKDDSAWNNLCWDLAKTGDLNDALSSCNQALALAPNSADDWDTLGFVDLKMKNDAAAITDYEHALKLDGNLASSYYGIGLAEQARGDLSDSKAFMAKATTLAPGVAKPFSP